MQRRSIQSSDVNLSLSSNGIAIMYNKQSQNFPDVAKYDDLYWSMWWFATFGWMKHLLRVTWTVANNVYVIPAHALYMVLLSPLCYMDGDAGKQLFWTIEETFYGWLLELVACWNYTAGYKVIESGDNLGDMIFSFFCVVVLHDPTNFV